MQQSVRVQIHGPISVLTLAASERQNRLDPDMLEALSHALDEVLHRSDVRVVILRAQGDVFCNGMDLGAAAAGGGAPADVNLAAQSAIRAYSAILNTLATTPLPVVALVDAPVRAGGVGLVAACDIVIAGPHATLELSEVLFGLIPANVLPYLLGWRVSPQRARYLVLTARKLSGAEALSSGLVDEYVESADGLEKAARSVVKGLLRSSPEALAMAKKYTAEWAGISREEAIGRAAAVLERLLADPAVRQNLAVFEQGALPPWFSSYRPSVPLSKE